MNKFLGKKLADLYKSGKKIELLELSYIAIFAVMIILAGLTVLLNQSVSTIIANIALICVVIFFSNYLIWILIKSTVDYIKPEDDKKEKKSLKK